MIQMRHLVVVGVVAAAACPEAPPTVDPGTLPILDTGVVWLDADGDGFPADEDCDDGDASIFPGATEIVADAIDQDCSGADLTDGDGDGFDAPAAGGDDCDDTDATVFPGALEVCDGLIRDCRLADHGQDDAGHVFARTLDGQLTDFTGQLTGPVSLRDVHLEVCGGVHDVALSLDGEVTIRGYDGATLDGGGEHLIVRTESGDADVVLEGLTLQHGVTDDDPVGAILGALGTTLTLRDCVVQDNEGDWSYGGIELYNGRLTIEDCVFRNNHDHALHVYDSVVDIRDSRFEAESGLVFRGGRITIADSEFIDANASTILLSSTDFEIDVVRSRFETTSDFHYWALTSLASSGEAFTQRVTLEDVTVTGYRSSAIRLESELAELVVRDSTFVDNTERSSSRPGGGAIHFEGRTLEVYRSRFEANTTTSRGGAIWARTEGAVVLEDVEFVGNAAGSRGGAIHVEQGSEPTWVLCTAGAGDYGFFGNTAPTAPAVWVGNSSASTPFESRACDFGVAPDDNVITDPDSTSEICVNGCEGYAFGDDATFRCDAAGVCG